MWWKSIEAGGPLGDWKGRSDMRTIEEILATYFPEIPKLYLYQEELLKSLGKSENSLGIIPNGGGRSLIFQIQAMREPGLSLVISPLQSYADEQVRKLNERGIPAATINGGKSFADQRTLLRTLPTSNLKLLYVSPDWLETTLFAKALEACKARVSMVVIDQAHAVGQWINQWGGAFRTDYGRISALLETLQNAEGSPKVLALTATLAKEPRHEIIRNFRISKVQAPNSIVRPHLKLYFHQVEFDDEKPGALRHWLESTTWTKALVYAFSRKKCESLAREFRGLGFNADFFHSLRTEAEKRDVYQRYENGQLNLLFATSAYGTGICVNDIDAIANYQIAHSVQDYYQMVGRGWRKVNESRDCHCMLFWSHDSFEMRLGWLKADETALTDIGRQIDRLYGSDRKSVEEWSLKSIRRDALQYARVDGILRNLYPLLVQEGVIEHLGILPETPDAIEMNETTEYWFNILTFLNSSKKLVTEPYETIERGLGLRFEDVCSHVYREELAGNIREFPATDHHVFFRVLTPDPDETTLMRVTAKLQEHIDLQKEEHEELRKLVTHDNPDEFLREVLG